MRFTGRPDRMRHRKWRETKQQPNSWPDLALLGCCLVSLHLLCDILSGGPVNMNHQFITQNNSFYWYLTGFFCVQKRNPCNHPSQMLPSAAGTTLPPLPELLLCCRLTSGPGEGAPASSSPSFELGLSLLLLSLFSSPTPLLTSTVSLHVGPLLLFSHGFSAVIGNFRSWPPIVHFTLKLHHHNISAIFGTWPNESGLFFFAQQQS